MSLYKPDAPTRDKVERLLQELKGYYGLRNVRFDAYEEMFKCKFAVPVPSGQTAIRAPTGYVMVREIIDQITAEFAQINVPRRKNTVQAQRQSEKMTGFLSAFWYQQQANRARNILRDILFFNCVRGPYCMRVMYDKDLWPDKPEAPVKPQRLVELEAQIDVLELVPDKVLAEYLVLQARWETAQERYEREMDEWEAQTQQECPIIIQVRDPKYVFWEPGVEDPSYVIECWDRTVADVRKHWPNYEGVKGTGRGLTRRRETEKVQWSEYWDSHWHFSMCSGEVVQKPAEHHYGFMPYIIGGGFATPLPDPEDAFHSLYYGVEGLIKYESALFTQMAHYVKTYAYGIWLAKVADSQGFKLDLTPSAINYVDPSDDVKRLDPTTLPPALDQQLANTQKFISRSAAADVLRGETGAGAPAYRYAMQTAMARTKFSPIEQSVQWAMQRANKMVLKLIENVHKEGISLFGQVRGEDMLAELAPDDIRHYYYNVVKLKTVQPIDEAGRAATGIRLNQSGIISKLTASEKYAGIEMPEAEFERILTEKILEHPEVQMAMAQENLKDWGYIDELAIVQDSVAKEEAMQQAALEAQQNQMPLSKPISPVGAPPHAPIKGTAEGQELEVRQQTRGQFRKGKKLPVNATTGSNPAAPIPFRK